MTYSLSFVASALKEWRKLDGSVREQFKKKLAQRLEIPHVPSAKLKASNNRYKIKLRDVGYRLVYDVVDETLIVTVIAVGRRDGGVVYDTAQQR